MKLADVVLAVTIMVVWGSNFVAAKAGLAQLPPILLIGLRFALVSVLLLPFVAVPRGRLGEIFLVGVTLGGVHFSLMFTGLVGVDAATAAIVIQMQVPFAALLAAIFFRDRLGWRRALGMATAIAGVAVIAGEPRVSADPTPVFLILGGGFAWALANIQLKRLADVDGFSLNAYVSLFAAPQLFALSALLEDGQVAALTNADWRAWGSVVYMAVVITIISYALWYRLLHKYPINQVMPFTLLMPVSGVLAGVLILDEPLTWRLVIGGLATVAGVGIIVLRRPRLAEPEATAKTT